MLLLFIHENNFLRKQTQSKSEKHNLILSYFSNEIMQLHSPKKLRG